MNPPKQYIKVVAVSLLLIFFSLFLHVAPFTNTMLNYQEEENQDKEQQLVKEDFLHWTVNYHQTLPDFKKRPLTTFLINQLSDLVNIHVSLAFVLINFTFTFLCGLLIYSLAKIHGLTITESIWSVVFFFTSYTILLAYFIPLNTYDEPIQYFFILLSLIALRKRLSILFILCFSLAMIARENTILLLPGLFIFLLDINSSSFFSEKIKLLKSIVLLTIPVVVYTGFLILFYHYNPKILTATQEVMSLRFSLHEKNFRDLENISRTFLSFSSVYLLPCFLLFLYHIKHPQQLIKNNWIKAFFITFLVNTVVVLVAVFAQESRVFTLPLLLIFPFFGKIIHQLIDFSTPFIDYLKCSKRVLVLFFSTSIAWLGFEQLYKLTGFDMNDNLFREYNTLSVFFIVLFLLYHRFSKTKQQQASDSDIAQ
jgi:hypothetical protein